MFYDDVPPWLVSLRLKQTNRHFCSGSLISHYFIISVAECVAAIVADHQLPADIMAIVGTENLFIGGGGYDINDVFIHPEFYGHEQRDNSNLALFQARAPILFTAGVHPIALESDCTSDYEELVMLGWGFLAKNGFSWKFGVIRRPLITLQREICALHTSQGITGRQLCTYFTSIATSKCIETPGNAIVGLKSSHLVAISSKTDSCNIRYPATNTRIAAHIGWISKIIRINEPQIVNMTQTSTLVAKTPK
ncbi:ovochymase-like [Culicoides brevitarsis]|uniref:ovochymase-like n=1 Tax=Culicoides brevitarsis TaxID=469753 RepID=UPI00307B92A7